MTNNELSEVTSALITIVSALKKQPNFNTELFGENIKKDLTELESDSKPSDLLVLKTILRAVAPGKNDPT